MVTAAVLGAAVILATVAGLAWTARLLRVGALDAFELADKTRTPVPASALDWPELRVRAAISEGIPGEPGLTLLDVERPDHAGCGATLLVDLGAEQERSLGLLERWCAADASVSPSRQPEGALELRRRQSLERVRAVLMSESYRQPSGDGTGARAARRAKTVGW